jgi:two-component system NtrC family sensor kinase
MTISDFEPAERYSVLSRQLLGYANRNLRKADFVREISRLLNDFSKCDAVGIRLADRGRLTCFEYVPDSEPVFTQVSTPCGYDASGNIVPIEEPESDLEWLCREISCGRSDPTLPCYTRRGSFWTGDAGTALVLSANAHGRTGGHILRIGGDFKSITIIPFLVANKDTGLLMFRNRRKDFFSRDQIEFYEEIAQILGTAFDYRRAHIALRERVKELTCLFGIAKISARPDIALDEVLQGTVELLPPGWLYPDIASARITLGEHSYSTRGFRDDFPKLAAEILVGGQKRGIVEVAYSEETPELDEGPFLTEERNLINAVAREVSLIIERRQVEEDKKSLHEQLRHADRLATIGQLAAGVAHELNEPLGNILGFAQLASKSAGIPDQVSKDIDKIVAASLHGREVIKKLMLFARQTPPHRQSVNLNKVVEDGLFFFESRFVKAGISLVREFEPGLPSIIADQSQLNQVLINLVVNAIQAMPEGGCLTIRTESHDDGLHLIVEDTGIGMNETTLEKLFIPFFTTKDVNEGTGLGLSVVHGIVTSHGGSVTVESEVGKGSRFAVQLPLNWPTTVKEQGAE